MASKNNWIQGVNANKGALHRQLGYRVGQKIPSGLLNRIVDTPIGNKVKVRGEGKTVTPLLKQRANFARNVRK